MKTLVVVYNADNTIRTGWIIDGGACIDFALWEIYEWYMILTGLGYPVRVRQHDNGGGYTKYIDY